jgi:uncharacterized protein (DUF111 family)
MGYLMQKLFEEKLVYDAWFSPIGMKKNRAATLFSVLCHEDHLSQCIDMIFKQSSAIGLRYYEVQRSVLQRAFKTVVLDGQQIAIKIAYDRDQNIVNYAPEYEDCVKAATQLQKPLKEIYLRVNQLIEL